MQQHSENIETDTEERKEWSRVKFKSIDISCNKHEQLVQVRQHAACVAWPTKLTT